MVTALPALQGLCRPPMARFLLQTCYVVPGPCVHSLSGGNAYAGIMSVPNEMKRGEAKGCWGAVSLAVGGHCF